MGLGLGEVGGRDSHFSQRRREVGHPTFIFCERLLIRNCGDLHHLDERNTIVNNQNQVAVRGPFSAGLQARLALCLWAIFAAGLLVEMAAPRLKIENSAFVLPPISDAQSATLRPMALVRRERWMQAAGRTADSWRRGVAGALLPAHAAGCVEGLSVKVRRSGWNVGWSIRGSIGRPGFLSGRSVARTGDQQNSVRQPPNL